MHNLDTLLDTLCEGRLSFLEISTFPKMLIYSTPTISSRMHLYGGAFLVVYEHSP
jgi:hypothetical protein